MAEPAVNEQQGGGSFLGVPREDLAWGLQAVATWKLLEEGDADALRYAAGVPKGTKVPIDDVVAPPPGQKGSGQTAALAGIPTWAWIVGGLTAGAMLVLLILIAARS